MWLNGLLVLVVTLFYFGVVGCLGALLVLVVTLFYFGVVGWFVSFGSYAVLFWCGWMVV